MSKLSTYPNKAIPVCEDKLIGTDIAGAATKNFTIENLCQVFGKNDYMDIYNDTGVEIVRGEPISVEALANGGVPHGHVASNTNILDYLGFSGLADENIAIGATGRVLRRGRLANFDTRAYANSFLYLGVDGAFMQTRPRYPSYRQLLGVVTTIAEDGVIGVQPLKVPRHALIGAYSFTSQGVGAGVYYKGGFYDWDDTDANLDEGTISIVHGIATVAYAAHASIVAGAAGVVDSGQVGLRVTGTTDDEEGTQTAGQTAIITEDITTLTADTYYETSEKFSGTVTFELYVVSGTPTAYSLDFNYGLSKYEDMQNQDFTVDGFQCLWRGGATDANFNVELLHHRSAGWTYAASGFIPGDSAICERAVDQQLIGNVASGVDGAYKRGGLTTFIDGNTSEGFIIRITTGSNNTIQTSDISVYVKIEEAE